MGENTVIDTQTDTHTYTHTYNKTPDNPTKVTIITLSTYLAFESTYFNY